MFEDQGTVSDFLGMRIMKPSITKAISMCQPGLIESIISDIGFSAESNTKFTPWDSILYNDSNGLPWEDTWNYRSIIGKLNFLAQNMQPDISFAVHQCTCFCTKPTKLHEIAVKQIVHYLQYNGMVIYYLYFSFLTTFDHMREHKPKPLHKTFGQKSLWPKTWTKHMTQTNWPKARAKTYVVCDKIFAQKIHTHNQKYAPHEGVSGKVTMGHSVAN